MRARKDTGFGLVQTLLRGAAALAQGWRRLIGEPYRPEKHYMRGPGPKSARMETHLPQDASHGR
jgi:hypothetical protein